MESSEDQFSLICKANPSMRCVFSFFLTPKANTKGSRLTLGGYDSTKAAKGAKWQYANVVPMQSFNDMYSMWNVMMNGFHVAGGSPSTVCTGWESCMAIVDSGTSYLAVPTNHWKKVMDAVTFGKTCRFSAPELQMQCTEPDLSKYPTLTFRFSPTSTFELKV
jgi:hypothetical protein